MPPFCSLSPGSSSIPGLHSADYIFHHLQQLISTPTHHNPGNPQTQPQSQAQTQTTPNPNKPPLSNDRPPAQTAKGWTEVGVTHIPTTATWRAPDHLASEPYPSPTTPATRRTVNSTTPHHLQTKERSPASTKAPATEEQDPKPLMCGKLQHGCHQELPGRISPVTDSVSRY